MEAAADRIIPAITAGIGVHRVAADVDRTAADAAGGVVVEAAERRLARRATGPTRVRIARTTAHHITMRDRRMGTRCRLTRTTARSIRRRTGSTARSRWSRDTAWSVPVPLLRLMEPRQHLVQHK